METRVANCQKEHPDVDAFEDRGCDITSVRKISVAAQIKRANEALMAVAARPARRMNGIRRRMIEHAEISPAAKKFVERFGYPGADRQRYERVAPLYDFLDLAFEFGRYRALRPQLFEGISGTVLDAGVGTGRNMPFYPVNCEVTGIDLSSAMLARASKRRSKLGKDVELLEMDVLATTFPDRHFDAIVATFLFCVLDEDRQLLALRELARICKPTGVIRLLDYTYSNDPLRRFMMRLWTPWVRWVYGAAFDRQTEQYIPQAGLEFVEKRFLYRDTIKLIVARPGSA